MSDTKLVAEITDTGKLVQRVEVQGEIIQEKETDVAALLAGQQFVSSFQEPALTLLTMVRNGNGENRPTDGHGDSEPTELGDPEIEGTPT